MKYLLLSALSAVALTSAAQANIDTTGSATTSISPFGAPDTATYGQTFTVAAGDTTLSSFSLYLNGTGSALTFRGYVAGWDGTKATNLLYTSGDTTISSNAAFQEFSFSPNVAVTAGSQYVAFLSISDFAAQPTSTYSMPSTNGSTDALAGGAFVFFNNGTGFDQLFNNTWSTFNSYDVAFKAGFNATPGVPEPATWALMIGGFGLAGATVRRRKSVSAFA